MSGAFRLRCRGVDIDAGRPLVMGVVNATPDSFSDGAEMANRPAQFARVDELVAAGADILDIGGQFGGYGSDTTRTIWVTGRGGAVPRVAPRIVQNNSTASTIRSTI